jgi:hypothetical protein
MTVAIRLAHRSNFDALTGQAGDTSRLVMAED